MKAAAALYGVDMVTDKPDSPHKLGERHQGRALHRLRRARPGVPATTSPALGKRLKAAGTKYRMETYTGAHHGFCFAGRPDYDPVAAERCWTTLFDLWDRNLKYSSHALLDIPDGTLYYEVHGSGYPGAAVRAGIPELAHRALVHQSREARRAAGLARSDAVLSRPFPADRARRAQRGPLAREAQCDRRLDDVYRRLPRAARSPRRDSMPRDGRVHRRVVRARARQAPPGPVASLVLQNPIGLCRLQSRRARHRVRQVGRTKCATGRTSTRRSSRAFASACSAATSSSASRANSCAAARSRCC